MIHNAEPPKVGEIVHYVSHGTPRRDDGSQAYRSECRAAVVTQVGLIRDRVGLCVLNPSGQFFNEWNDHDPGTFVGPAREAAPGEPLPEIGCHELDFAGGTWHRPQG